MAVQHRRAYCLRNGNPVWYHSVALPFISAAFKGRDQMQAILNWTLTEYFTSFLIYCYSLPHLQTGLDYTLNINFRCVLKFIRKSVKYQIAFLNVSILLLLAGCFPKWEPGRGRRQEKKKKAGEPYGVLFDLNKYLNLGINLKLYSK